MEEAGSDSNPKYLNELFILLQVVLLCQEVAKLKCFSSASVGRAQLWDPFKAALTVFTAKGLGKQKDLKKNHTALARLMGLALDETITAAAGGPFSTKSSLKKDTTRTTAAAKSTTKNNGSTGESGVVVGSVMTTTKKTKSNRPGDKEKKEAKKRRMTASAEGFTNDVTFAQVDIDIDVAPEDDEVVQEVVGDRKKRRKDSKKTMTGSHKNTNGNQVESLKEEVKKKKSKKEVDDETLKEEETLSTPVDGNFKRKTCLTFKSTTFFPTCSKLLNLINIDCRSGRRIDRGGQHQNRQEKETTADDN